MHKSSNGLILKLHTDFQHHRLTKEEEKGGKKV